MSASFLAATRSTGTAPTDRNTAPAASPADYAFFREVLRDRAAIILEPSRDYLIDSRLGALARAEGISSISELIDWIRRQPRGPLEAKAVEAMTINETSFFRDIHPFKSLADHVLPEIFARNPGQPVHIWCAACSSGQEPYSLAMTVLEHFPDKRNLVRITATDLSPKLVQRTQNGRFSQLEINRGMPAKLLVRYFDRDGAAWVAKPELRSMIRAQRLNLIEPWVGLPRFDLVMMRNVLIYFTVDTKQQILAKVRRDALKPGGMLLLGGSETTLNIDSNFALRKFDRTIFYQPSS